MFCLLDDKGVIHISKPKPGWIAVVLMALDSNAYMNRLATMRLMGGTYDCAMDLLIILT